VFRAYYIILVYSLIHNKKAIFNVEHERDGDMLFRFFFVFRFDTSKKLKQYHTKTGIVFQSHVWRLALARIVFISPSTRHGRPFFWNSFLLHPSMFVFLVFFIDNNFGSFRHQSSLFLWSSGAQVLCASRLGTKSLKYPGDVESRSILRVTRFSTFSYFFTPSS